MDVRRRIKLLVYRFCKRVGLFWLARAATRRSLRILCYHGFALSDEDAFRPKLFMRPETFRQRLASVQKSGYEVLPLDLACQLLASGRLPKRAVAITIDDGFYSVFHEAWPILRELSMPATLYVTSYYVSRQNPIFRLVVQYIFWRTEGRKLQLADLGSPFSAAAFATTEQERESALWEIIRHGEEECDENQRCELLRELGKRAGIDYDELRMQRRLSLISAEEIRQLSSEGMDIQLHTHRHCLPEDEKLAQREITQNREFLEPLARSKLHHLCYPSGIWSRRHWPWLQELDIRTASTCDVGLNYQDTPLLGLKRFLDGENISSIEFEAELAGLTELLRVGWRAFRQ